MDDLTGFDVSKVNYDLTVEQDDGDVTITGDIKVMVEHGNIVTGFGTIRIPETSASTLAALISWKVDDEVFVWLIGNATTTFTIKSDDIEYTIDVTGINWPELAEITKADLTGVEDIDFGKINYSNLTVVQRGTKVTITGDIAVKVTHGDYVKGFGNIRIPETSASTQAALISWMVDDELFIWLVGNATTTFTIEWDGMTYTIDVRGLNWSAEG